MDAFVSSKRCKLAGARRTVLYTGLSAYSPASCMMTSCVRRMVKQSAFWGHSSRFCSATTVLLVRTGSGVGRYKYRRCCITGLCRQIVQVSVCIPRRGGGGGVTSAREPLCLLSYCAIVDIYSYTPFLTVWLESGGLCHYVKCGSRLPVGRE